jgi:hypothetical protein
MSGLVDPSAVLYDNCSNYASLIRCTDIRPFGV